MARAKDYQFNKLKKGNIIYRWGLSIEEISFIIESNPSLRGMVFGYVSEFKARKMWFERQEFTNLKKYDDHDRIRKGDLFLLYKDTEIRIEVKSLQSHSVKETSPGEWKGSFQCDASDNRTISLPNGESVKTTCLLVGEFDLLAVSLFQFGGTWRFAFARNSALPRSKYFKYSEETCQYLIRSSIRITWPLQDPFYDEPFALLDSIVEEKRRDAKKDNS